jgi:hypothetical protein
VSGVPLGNADGEVETAVDQNAIGEQMELQVETEIQDDQVTAGEYWNHCTVFLFDYKEGQLELSHINYI